MKLLFVAISLCYMMVVKADITISDVHAVPLSPWGVRVSYEVNGDLPLYPQDYSLKIIIVDTDTGKSYSCSTACGATISGDTRLSTGSHVVVWNAASDLVSLNFAKAAIRVCYTDDLYCVIDLSGGASAERFPVRYIDEIPNGCWSDEYKTTKLVLKRVGVGSYKTDSSVNPLYLGVFEVTQKQWELVMGTNPCAGTEYGKGDSYPVHYVSYESVRGWGRGGSAAEPNEGSFIATLRKKTGLDKIDLPTLSQIQYATFACESISYVCGNPANGNYFWFSGNSGGTSHVVGTKEHNTWGYYDLQGNVAEWGLVSKDLDSVHDVYCQERLGSWDGEEYLCFALTSKATPYTKTAYKDVGFRVSMAE